MKKHSGKLLNKSGWIIGTFTTKNNIFIKNRIVKCTKIPLFTYGAKCFIVTAGTNIGHRKIPVFLTEEKLEFEENDVITINPNGKCCIAWEYHSPHNALYVTDICNSNCIMCPQVTDKKSRYFECFEILKHINIKNIETIGITGGEPTLEIENLVKILMTIAQKSPSKKVHILTNGRQFETIENVQKLAKIQNINISYGIPLHSDLADEHDYIAGANGAFQQTVKGLYNLAKYRQKIEIRIVILRQNYKILSRLAKYIYRNLPFVTHIALMGMEYHGNAETNYSAISIDPKDYQEELYQTIKCFVRYNIPVDVYNLPLCLADKRIHKFCRDSISSWKKYFLSQCENCYLKDKCCGLFATSFIHSTNIIPISS